MGLSPGPALQEFLRCWSWGWDFPQGLSQGWDGNQPWPCSAEIPALLELGMGFSMGLEWVSR